jgi:hypothetical protein
MKYYKNKIKSMCEFLNVSRPFQANWGRREATSQSLYLELSRLDICG